MSSIPPARPQPLFVSVTLVAPAQYLLPWTPRKSKWARAKKRACWRALFSLVKRKSPTGQRSVRDPHQSPQGAVEEEVEVVEEGEAEAEEEGKNLVAEDRICVS
jgi:hypothetical protein